MIPEIGRANRQLAAYGGLLEGIPNPFVLLSPLTAQEAVLSSKIEGTQATLQDMLKYEAGEKPLTESQALDIQEILNYRKAMGLAVDELNRKPLSLNLLKILHRTLLDGVRGQNLRRGEFRRTQNHIGRPGSTIEQASYVPPAPENVLSSLDNWEKYIHYSEADPIVQAGIIHAQFEIIHPFMDGNGRIGRMIIPLFLFEKGIIPYPTFYLSSYFEGNRDEYYSRLNAITGNGEWEEWIAFFLSAIVAEADSNAAKARAILELYNAMAQEVVSWTRSQHAMAALDILFSSPVISSSIFVERLRIPRPSATRMLRKLQDEHILEVLRAGRGSTPAILVFSQLLDIVES